jgi:hypothetical protein
MKYIKLFENFGRTEQELGPFLIGYYGEGGIGSHPAIFTESHLIESGWSNKLPSHLIAATADTDSKSWTGTNDFQNFFVTDETPTLPEALICAFDENALWDIKGISRSAGQRIMKMIGGDTIDGFDANNKGMVDEIVLDTGVFSEIPKENLGDKMITIILDPRPNTIYWSEVPEATHGYWEPPYEPVSLKDREFGY